MQKHRCWMEHSCIETEWEIQSDEIQYTMSVNVNIGHSTSFTMFSPVLSMNCRGLTRKNIAPSAHTLKQDSNAPTLLFTYNDKDNTIMMNTCMHTHPNFAGQQIRLRGLRAPQGRKQGLRVHLHHPGTELLTSSRPCAVYLTSTRAESLYQVGLALGYRAALPWAWGGMVPCQTLNLGLNCRPNCECELSAWGGVAL